MKTKITLVFAFFISVGFLKAQDFTINGINYKITATDIAVEITTGSCYSGDLALGDTVENNGITYNITSIGAGAFSNCTSITKITVPNLVTTIKSSAFSGCSNLTDVVLNNSISIIDARAFKDCTNLTHINIPDSVTQIYDYAFQNCSKLTSLNLSENIQILREGIFLNSGLTSFTFPESVSSIPNDFFNSCSDLSSVTIPNSVKNIGDDAFRSCTSLTTINLPSDLEEIRESTFEASGLTSITIPNKVTEIELQAFRDCRDLTTVTFSSTLETIGINAFQRCTKLDNVVLPNSLKAIKNRAFQECYAFTEISIPNSVTTISDYAFYKCFKLETVTLSNTLTALNAFVFDNCLKLEELNIPNSVTTIADFSLSNNGLKKVTVNWQTPLAITSNVFANNDLSVAELVVPTGTESLYEVADVWKDFGTTSTGGSTGNPDVTAIPDANFEQYLIDENIDSDGTINGQVLKSDIENVTQVIVTGKNISDLTGIQCFTNLIELNAANNQISTVDLSKNIQLEKLFIANNQLSALNLSNNIKLKNVDVGENSLSTLEVHLLPNLETLSCYKNQLTLINTYSNSKLVSLICNENQLKHIDIRENKSLFWIDVDDNNLESLTIKNGNNSIITTLSATGNPNLTCIEVDDVNFSNSNWTNKDATASYSTDCAPSNDDCANAIPLTFGQQTPGDVNSGNANNNANCVVGNVIADVWFSVVVPQSGEFSIEGTGFGGNLKFAIYETCSSNNPISCGNAISLTNLTVGATYYLKVWLESASSRSQVQSENGTFTIQANESSVLSVDDVTKLNNNLFVFPNPASSIVNIKTLNNDIIEKVELFNMLGKRVLSKKNNQYKKLTIDIANLPKGIYFLRTKIKNQITSKRLIIK